MKGDNFSPSKNYYSMVAIDFMPFTAMVSVFGPPQHNL